VIHHEQTLAEMRDWVTDEKGTGYENGGESDHDDHVMALAIAIVVDALEMPPPAYMPVSPEHPASRPITTVSTADDGRIIADNPMEVTPRQDAETDSHEPIVPWELWGEMEDQ
jgi:hypothetical protein